ncbi:Orf 5' of aeg-46-5 protein [Escherichia coli]|uniref:Orf 5' of aeg-46.5 protein n=1 Tax=Escherichia coli TaxID=562 RepID=Q53300_ECOLX|nr:orf 5' of aeg-46.5 gene product [Escherichia coli]CAI4146601.1 Orf 5' of aeg-46-5 protein [Escherichia coli]CAI6172317.1 Orf 5' of aeg-46-5 protein [Escherichia coli]CAI6173166.1 Orf 5' of aeg-46-5 protein [Escherichia coli]CAI6175409.1 Orf 5' of aeg-46-5 protein [Escherichia coli]
MRFIWSLSIFRAR